PGFLFSSSRRGCGLDLALAAPHVCGFVRDQSPTADLHFDRSPSLFFHLVVFGLRDSVGLAELWDRECRSWWRRPAWHRPFVNRLGDVGPAGAGRELSRPSGPNDRICGGRQRSSLLWFFTEAGGAWWVGFIGW